MGGAQVKAIMMIIMIFGGIALYISGGIALKMPDFSGVKTWFAQEKKSSKKSSKKKKSSSGRAPNAARGKVIDSYKGVDVYYNGNVGNVSGRNTTRDGYNLGLKYQCVEFAKRFYYEAYNHKMPDSYGHARDFYDSSVGHGGYNTARGMYQFVNGGPQKPKPDDLVIIGPSTYNKFGHLFIITKVTDSAVEFIQQNPGANNPSRGRYPLHIKNGNYYIDADKVVGWLRMS